MLIASHQRNWSRLIPDEILCTRVTGIKAVPDDAAIAGELHKCMTPSARDGIRDGGARGTHELRAGGIRAIVDRDQIPVALCVEVCQHNGSLLPDGARH